MAATESPSRPIGSIEVRRLAYGDLPGVLSIERRSFPAPWSLAMFVLELSKPSGICLAADTGDGLAGYLVCSRYADIWHVMNVAVDPERRREGIGRRLLSEAVRIACSRGCHAVWLDTSSRSTLDFYLSLGFTAFGTLSNVESGKPAQHRRWFLQRRIDG